MPATDAPPLVFCHRHTGNAASYRCEECSRPLCPACVDEGHRLFFCSLCGGRALPLADGPSITSPRLRRQRGHRAPIPVAATFLYPLRGLGGYGFWGFLLLWVPISWLGTLRGFACGSTCLKLLLLCLVPGLVLQVVRTTYDGADELPEWPELTDITARLRETFLGLMVIATGFVPAVALLHLAGCVEQLEATGSWRSGCQLLFTAGFFIGACWWIAVLGAVALYDNDLYVLRLPLQLRLLRLTWPDCVTVAAAITLLFAAANLLHGSLDALPGAGPIASTVLAVYALLLAPHWIGLLYRRHLPAVEALWSDDQG